MHTGRLTPHIYRLIYISGLAVLAALFLSPDLVFAADPAFDTGLETTINLPENTAANEDVGDAYTATDSDMDTLTWTLTGTDASSFTIVSTSGQIQTKSGVTYDFEATKNTYSVTVGVHDGNDGMGNTDTSDDATIDVTINLTDVNEAPDLTTTTSAYNFAENTLATTAVATFEASDPDSGAVLTWTLTGADADDFEISKDSEDSDQDGILTFKSSPDFETPAGTPADPMDPADNTYEITVNVRDSKDADGMADTTVDDSLAVVVTVTNANDAPTIDSGPTAISKPENTATSEVLGTYTASDADARGDTLSWSLEGDDAGDFSITTDGKLSFAQVPDYEMPADKPGMGETEGDNEYKVTIKVTDDGSPAASSTREVTVTVTDVNEAPDMTTTTSAYNFAENTLATTAVATFEAADPDSGAVLTWTLTGSDAGDFNITKDSNQDGILTFKNSPNFEMPAGTPADSMDPADNTYEITVNVRDSKDADGMADTMTDDSLAVVVTVTNVDEDGTVSISGTLEGGEELTASVTDPDGTVSSLTWQWSRGDTADGTFTNIGSATSNKYTSIAADVGKFLRATASYKDPESATDDKTALATTSSAIAASNSEPEFSADTATRTLPENSAAGVDVVGGTVTATDDDSDTLEYSLTGTDIGSFEIDANGQIKTKSGVTHDFNFEATKNSYTVTVQVSDKKDAASDADTVVDDTIDVTINLTNVNETPTIDSGPADDATIDVDENTATTVAIATYEASDVDAMTTLTWTLTGDDAADFEITKDPNDADQDGVLTFKNSPDFEMPAGTPADPMDPADNTYEITVQVSDGALSATRNLVVSVDDVNEAPVISGNGTPSFAEIEFDVDGADLTTANLTVPGTYTFADEDGDDVSWTLSGTDASHFQITKNTDGSSFVSFRNPSPSTTDKPANFESPLDSDNNNDYVFVVEATDDNTSVAPHNQKGTFNVTVTVTNVDEAPEFTNPPADKDFAEIEYDFDGTPDLVVATFTARDEEMEDITWTISGDDAEDFSIVENPDGHGVVSFASSPDFEMPAGTPATEGGDPDNTYEFTVEIEDATVSPNTPARMRALEYVVTVTDVNERPDIDEITGNAISYTEVDFYLTGTPAIVHTFTATDYDDNGMDSFSWSLTGDDAGDFAIDSSTGDLTFVQDDSLGVGPLPSFEDAQDHNTDNTYSVTVIATDDDTEDQKASQYAITVTVADKEEAGAVATALPNDPPQVDDVLTFTLSDPDGGILLTSGAIDWSIEARRPAEGSDPAGPWVEVDDADPVSLVKTYTLDEDDTGQEIRATVTYTDRRGAGKAAESTPTAVVVDERLVAPPRFRSGADQTIPEGDPGRDTGAIITATDSDGEVLIWGIKQGPHSDLFEIIPSAETMTFTFRGNDYPGYTAQLRFIEALDYEALPADDKTLSLTITLSDGKGVNGTDVVYDDAIDVEYPVTVTVTNVDEPGEIDFAPEEAPEPGVEITATLTDGDGNVSGESWQWQRSEDPEAETPVWNDISGATAATYTPDSTDDVVSGGDNDGEGYYLQATVTYTDGEGGNKTATAVAGQMGTSNTPPSSRPPRRGSAPWTKTPTLE